MPLLFRKDQEFNSLTGPLSFALCGSDDTVSVGSDLYQIDTDSVKITDAGASDPKPAAMSATTTIPELRGSISHRTPLIRFLGKAGWAEQKSFVKVNKELEIAANQDVYQHFAPVQLEPYDVTWNPMYGRPPISENEIESLVMGGASEAPKLLRPSSGAIFE
jgi:hypothetical protein